MRRTACALLLLAVGWMASAAQAFDAGNGPQRGTHTATGTIQVAFTPGDNATWLIVDAIQKARHQVLVMAYSFTSRNIAVALIAARQRGVDVQLIADPRQAKSVGHSLVDEIAAAGVPTFFDDQHDSAHNKVMLIDGGGQNAVVITGSFNFTQAAQQRNAENLLLIRGNPSLTAAYLDNWRQHRAHAVAFRYK
ncbi:MAG: phospholipase D family protein [Sulfuricella sp.]|nr:phospholipase D family protein [Sulfuricella sp.]